MDGSILGAISNEAIRAIKYMNPKDSPRVVLVRTESKNDIPFWRKIFKDNDKVHFNIVAAGSESNKGFGKSFLLKAARQKKLGDSYLVCVDSDYSYLLQDSTSDSKEVNNNPYIFQTYVYALENFQCNALTLKEVCEKSYNCTVPLDISGEISRYSQRIYELLLLSILVYKNNKGDLYSIADYNLHVGIAGHIVKHKDSWFKEFEQELEANHKDVYSKVLSNVYSDNKEELEKELADTRSLLNSLSFDKNECYLITQGHGLKANVRCLLKFLCKPTEYNLIEEIKNRHKDDPVTRTSEISSYFSACAKVEDSLNDNDRYETCCYFYNKIRSKVDDFITTNYW